MPTLWLLVAGLWDGSMDFLPILANSKKDVGSYIRNNIDKVFFMFEGLAECDEYHGKTWKQASSLTCTNMIVNQSY